MWQLSIWRMVEAYLEVRGKWSNLGRAVAQINALRQHNVYYANFTNVTAKR